MAPAAGSEFENQTHVEVRCSPLPPSTGGDNQPADDGHDQHAFVFKFEARQCHVSNLSNRRIQHSDTITYSSQPIACQSLISPTEESCGIIAKMVTEDNIPYPFDESMKWYRFEGKKTIKLDSREDLVGHIVDKARQMSMYYASSFSSRPRLQPILLRIEKVVINEDIRKQERLDYLNGYVSQLLEWSCLSECLSLSSMVSSIEGAILASQPKDNVDQTYERNLFRTMMGRLRRELYDTPAVVPAPKSCIENLPRVRFEGDGRGGISTNSCAICWEDMLVGEYVTVLPCNHIHHNGCIVRWLKRNHTCPHCRFELPT